MKYIMILVAVLVIVSCRNYKREAEQLEMRIDSLQAVTAQRDSTIDEFVRDFETIQANLDSIRRMERLIPESGESERRLTGNQRDQIIDDIGTINNLLSENQELIANLKRRINNSNLQTNKLETMVNELEEQSNNLRQQLQQRDTEMGQLSEQVKEHRENIELLQRQLNEATEYSVLQTDTLKMRTTALNRGFYTVGTISELRDEGIVDRQGGILGIGSTPVMRRDFDPEQFEEVDIRNFEYLPLDARRAELISVHPAESYRISGDNQADTLYIEDPRLFWTASKYLVVAVR